jgi:RNA polymerase sigma-70 factor (ECF subfamily)
MDNGSAQPQDDERADLLPDTTLAARVAARDVAAFELLYDRYVRLVYALAARALGTTEAQETVQDVFLQLWRSAGQFDPNRGSFGAWFTAIARHRVLEQMRARGRERRFAAAEGIDRAMAQTPDLGPGIEEIAERAESAATALRALQTLPPEQRRVLVLAYFGGMSQSAIAEHLGLPLGTVKKRVRLGMQKLRAMLVVATDPASSNSRGTRPPASRNAGEGRSEPVNQP